MSSSANPATPMSCRTWKAFSGETGRTAEANVLASRLEQLEPHPAFSYFNRGMKALQDGNPAAARELFAKEVDRAPYYHEFRFWLGIAYLRLGDDRSRAQGAQACHGLCDDAQRA